MNYKEERNSKFLGHFWDLASDNDKTRIIAGTNIIKFLVSNEESDQHKQDIEYTVKRLIKGLCSSRQSARQGFATCFCELLRTFGFKDNKHNVLSVPKIIDSIEDETRITGSLKGAEERDNIFGRMFGLLALLKSGFLTHSMYVDCVPNKEIKVPMLVLSYIHRIMAIFMGIYKMKGWGQEIIIESVFTLLYSLTSRNASAAVISDEISVGAGIRILSIILSDEEESNPYLEYFQELSSSKQTDVMEVENGCLEDIHAPNQLMFLLGLQQYLMSLSVSVAKNASLTKSLNNVITLIKEKYYPHGQFLSICAPDTVINDVEQPCMSDYTSILLASTSGYPKMHSVWNYMFNTLVCTHDRPDDHKLQLWMEWVNTYLISSSSHEKKSVGLKLIPKYIMKCSPEQFPIIITKNLVRLLVVSRVNKQHTLHQLSGQCIKEIELAVTAAGGVGVCEQQVQCKKLAVVGLVTQYGNANFDNYTNTTLLSSLLKQLDENAIKTHMEFLCNMLVESKSNFSELEGVEARADGEDEEDSVDVKRNALMANMMAALESFVTIAKGALNNKTIATYNPYVVCNSVCLLLIRIGCFTSGELAVAVEGNEFIRILETGDSSAIAFPVEVIQKAQKLLMQLLADTGHMSVNTVDTAITIMDIAVKGLMNYFHACYSLAAPSATPKNTPSKKKKSEKKSAAITSNARLIFVESLNNATEGEDSEMEPAMQQSECIELLRLTGKYYLLEPSKEVGNSKKKMTECYNSLLSNILFFILTTSSSVHGEGQSEDGDKSSVYLVALQDLCGLYRVLVNNKAPASTTAEDDEEVNPLMKLLHGCEVFLINTMEDLTQEDSHTSTTIRGIRSSIKKVWHAVWSYYGSDACPIAANEEDSLFVQQKECLDAVMQLVVNNDDFEGEEEAGGEDEIGMEEDGLDEEEESSSESESDSDSESEEEEEVSSPAKIVEAEQVSDAESDSDSDDSTDGIRLKNFNVEHTESADDALVKMIKLQKLERKQGQSQRKRQEYIIRTRMVDILECIVHNMESNSSNTARLLTPMLHPLLCCSKKNMSQVSSKKINGKVKKVVVSTENKAFAQRLNMLIEQKVCKKGIDVNLLDNDDTNGSGDKEVENGAAKLCKEIRNCLVSPDLILRNVGLNIFLCCVKSSASAVEDYINVNDQKGAEKRFKALLSSINENAVGKEASIGCVMPFIALTKDLFNSFVYKKNNRHSLSNKVFEQLISKNNANFISLILWSDLVTGCSGGKDAYLRGECMKWLGSLLKRHHEISALGKKYIIHTSDGSGLQQLISTVGSVVSAIDEKNTNSISWKRLKPLCDCLKECLDYFVKSQCDAAETTTAVKTVFDIISGLCSHASIKSQPGIKSIVQYYNNIANKTSNMTIDINNLSAVSAISSEKKRANVVDEETVKKPNKKHKK